MAYRIDESRFHILTFHSFLVEFLQADFHVSLFSQAIEQIQAYNDNNDQYAGEKYKEDTFVLYFKLRLLIIKFVYVIFYLKLTELFKHLIICKWVFGLIWEF